MHAYDSAYNEKLHEAWEKFIQHEPFDYSFIRPEIYDSWVRSRSYLVDPYNSKTSLLSPDELKKRIEDNKILIEITRPYMKGIELQNRPAWFHENIHQWRGCAMDQMKMTCGSNIS